MSKNISIDRLNEHLFESIEMLKNNKDPQADEHEKMDIETAKAIADLSKVAIEGYKVKAQVLSLYSKTENPKRYESALISAGFVNDLKELPE